MTALEPKCFFYNNLKWLPIQFLQNCQSPSSAVQGLLKIFLIIQYLPLILLTGFNKWSGVARQLLLEAVLLLDLLEVLLTLDSPLESVKSQQEGCNTSIYLESYEYYHQAKFQVICRICNLQTNLCKIYIYQKFIFQYLQIIFYIRFAIMVTDISSELQEKIKSFKSFTLI